MQHFDIIENQYVDENGWQPEECKFLSFKIFIELFL